MLKILELIVHLHEVITLLEKLLQQELRKEGITLSIQEIICLSQSAQMSNNTIQFLAENSVFTYQHLLFNLNKLERKNLIDLKANPKIQKELFITVTSKGEKIIQLLNQKQKKLLLDSIPQGLDSFKEELFLKLK